MVQMRMTKLVLKLETLEYEQRFEQLEFTSLEMERCQGNMTEIYKILKGVENVG